MFKKTLTGLSTALMVLAISAALLFGWSKTGWRALAIPTGSMEPTISQGSLAVVHHVSPESLKVGDVITYTDPLNHGRTISHRIIKTYLLSGKVPAFVTKGDANKVPDVPITSGSVLGRVTLHVPQLGSLLLGSKTWVGLAVLVYLPALLLIFEEMKRMTEYLKLSVPYKLYGYRARRGQERSPVNFMAASTLASLVLVASLAFGPSALALLRSNQVALTNNILTKAATTTPPGSGTTTTTTTTTNTTCTNNTNVNLTSNNNQTATTGNATTTTNTTGGTASSSNASNTNSTSGTITVINSGC